jgi:F-type H+-transporting ATPase subunit b
MSASVFATIGLLAEEHGKPNVLPFDLDLALFSLVVFLGLMALLGTFAWKPILQALTNREKRISDQIDSAHQANEKALSTLKQYEQRLAAAAEQASQVLAQARQEGIAAKDRIVAEAQAEAHRQRERAIADIQAARNEALRELAERSVDSAVALAGNLLAKEIDKSAHSRLIRESIDRFATTGQPN